MPQLKVGDTIYHEARYWKLDHLRPDEVPGWNATYEPYRVVRLTASTIFAARGTDHVRFSRVKRPHKPGRAPHETLEADGRQYHSRFSEYFYTAIPQRERPRAQTFRPQSDAASMLGLPGAYTAEDVNRAYKRLARQHHPDAGGTHEAFVKLKQARDAALAGAGTFSAGSNVSGAWRCSCGATMDFRVSGVLGDVGAHLIETFLSQHRRLGHQVTKVA